MDFTGRPRFRPADFLILLAALGITAAVAAQVWTGGKAAALVVAAGSAEYVYPLDHDRDLAVEGALGVTRIRIRDGIVTIEDSPCEHKTCMASPPLKGHGDWSACLPNAVILRIESEPEKEEAFDAVVR